MATLSSLMLSPSALHASPRNARLHPPEQVSQLAASIRAHGFGAPIIADGSGEILAGHGRLLAAVEAGLDLVPVIRVSGLTPDEADTFRLLDNRLGELSLWDTYALSRELMELRSLVSVEDLRGVLDAISLTLPEADLCALLPLTASELGAFISRARADFAEGLSGGFAVSPRHLMDALDTSAADAIIDDPAARSCPPELQRVLEAAAARLLSIDYSAARAYYLAASAGSAIRKALIASGLVRLVSPAEASAQLRFFDAMADALRADFGGV